MKQTSKLFVTLTALAFLIVPSCTPTTIVPVTSISLRETSKSLYVGDEFTLVATIEPADATNQYVTWLSSDESIATVNDGLVSALDVGTVNITCISKGNSSIAASCHVTIKDKSKEPSWTIMIYMCGSDLESSFDNRTREYSALATADISEILSVNGQPDDVNIIIETGGAKTWSSSYGISSKNLERWHVENKQLVKDASLIYASMGHTSTFQSFLEWGLSEYPAEKTGVILWNHGGGMTGVCFDEKKSDDSLLNSEVSTAVSNVFNKLNITDKLEFIGYDACLMQVQDIAEFNSQYFNYMIGSEENEAGEGWAYDSWVDNLYAHDDTELILKEACDGFIKYFDDYYGRWYDNDQTLSCLDLSKMNAYKTAWENLANQLKNKITSSNKSSFNSLVDSCKHFADTDYDYFGLFDAKDFINKLANNSTFNPGSSYTNAVLTAFNELVKYSAKGGQAGNANGLCMYWDIHNSAYHNYYYTNSETSFTNWKYLVDNFYGSSSGGGWWN